MRPAWACRANAGPALPARGQASAAAKRETASLQADATRQLIDFWTGNTAQPAKARRKRR